MKKALLTTAIIGLLAASSAFALDHSQMHEMMMKEGGPKEDTRTELKIPEPMKVMHKGIMRSHLDAVSDITAALAANEMEKAAKIAKGSLGWNESQEKVSSVFGETVSKNFPGLRKSMNKKADELAEAARAGNRDKAFADLSRLIKNCNACHERYRH